MGKGHKDRRREKRAVELQDRESDINELKAELAEENEKIQAAASARKKSNEEKLIETSSDTDSGHGTSIATVTDSPQQDELKRRTLIKGLVNIGNTCFFNVIIQSLAHTDLLIDTMYRTIRIAMEDNDGKHKLTTTTQLIKVFDEFTSADRKKTCIDPKQLFNSLISKIPSYKGYDQHDSHELFMNLMLILRAEEVQLRKLKSKPSANSENDDDPSKMFCLIGCNEPYTSYDSIFGGHLLDVITCKKCSKSLMKIEPFFGLLLPLTDRISPEENYRNRRKRENNTRNKSKKEPQVLSRKQQKALKKQEKKNSRRSATGGSGKIKGRQIAKQKVVQEQLPIEEPSPANEENETKETVDAKAENSIPEEQQPTPENKEEEQQPTTENKEEEQQPTGEDNQEEPADEDSEDNDEEEEEQEEEEQQPKGPLTAVESTYMLSDMVSKLTLIHETSSRPLPFVDENIAQKFLNCHKNSKDSTETSETDDIRTLDHCFQRYFKPEILSGENLFDCYYCRSLDKTQKRVLTEATRQTVFFQLPPILPVFLKRFQMYGLNSEKIHKFIEFPLEFDLIDRCSSQVPLPSTVYSLYAVIEHMGTLRSGHYIAYIKQSFNDNDFSDKIYSKPIDFLLANLFQSSTNEQDQTKNNNNTSETADPSAPTPSWYHISDNTIHKVPETKVLEADAYVLFYRRK